MIKNLSLLFLSLFLGACSHTLRIPMNHFATPVAGNGAFEGQVSMVYETETPVSFVRDSSSANPENYANYGDTSLLNILEDTLVIANLNYNFQISPINAIDIYRNSSVWGLKWQFLGHKAQNNWVGSLMGGYGTSKDSLTLNHSSSNLVTSEYDIKQYQYGVSLGYQWTKHIGYVSALKNDFTVETDLTNQHGSWAFKNKGTQTDLSIGLASIHKGLEYGVEYNFQMADWKDTDGTEQGFGLKLGYRWL